MVVIGLVTPTAQFPKFTLVAVNVTPLSGETSIRIGIVWTPAVVLVGIDHVNVCTVGPTDPADVEMVQMDCAASTVPQVGDKFWLKKTGEDPLLVTVTFWGTPALVKSSDDGEKIRAGPDPACPAPVNATCKGEFGAVVTRFR
jgi:hypothetical protein